MEDNKDRDICYTFKVKPVGKYATDSHFCHIIAENWDKAIIGLHNKLHELYIIPSNIELIYIETQDKDGYNRTMIYDSSML